MPLLLDDHKAVHATLNSFNLTENEIPDFFVERGVSPSGVVDLAAMMCAGVLAMAEEDGGRITGSMLMATFTGGVALGLKLADEHAESKRQRLRLVLHPCRGLSPRG